MKFSLVRAKILTTIKDNEPINISLLSQKVGISSGSTIYRYLRELEKNGLIEIIEYDSKDKKRGKPVSVKTTKKAWPWKKELIDAAINFFKIDIPKS